MPEQSAPRLVFQRNTPEAAAAEVGDAVMACESFIDESVVSVDQIENAAILANDCFEEQFRLAPKRVAQVAVDVLRAGRHVVELTQQHPLAREAVHERACPLIGQHSPGLPLQLDGVVKPAGCRDFEKLGIRDAAPEKK